MSSPTLDGEYVFGYAVTMKMMQNPTAEQISAFFGVDGIFSLYGGQRGRHFAVMGLLYGQDLPSLNAAEAVWDTSQAGNFADGVGRTLVTTRGVEYSNVIYRGEYEPDEAGAWFGICPGGAGYVLRYRLLLRGLT